MSRIYEYQETIYYGENSIDEYLDRIGRMHRMPTMINEAHNHDHHLKLFHENHHSSPQSVVVHNKVHFSESEKLVEVERQGKHQDYEEKTIDVEADGFIQKRHKNFDSCNTFKGY